MTCVRIPEATELMEDQDSISAFNFAGKDDGPLSAIYDFCTRGVSSLLPSGGTVLDIGCGPGRFLTQLLSSRQDCRGVGCDLSKGMLEVAERAAVDRGISKRLELVTASFSEFDSQISQPVDVIVSMSALHHCADFEALTATLTAISRLVSRTNCAVWLFDLVRPESAELVELIPRAYEVSAQTSLDPAFKKDWIDSLKAGWTFGEFNAASVAAGLKLESSSADYSQLHWSGLPCGNAGSPLRLDIEKPSVRVLQLASALSVRNLMGIQPENNCG